MEQDTVRLIAMLAIGVVVVWAGYQLLKRMQARKKG
jgi:hypothetical protein